MAMVDGGLELEDGEIDDLEDGEIDENVPLSTEASNNVFSRLEPRNGDSFSEKLQDSQGVNSRDFVFQSSVPPSGPWEQQGTSFSSLSRSRFRRGRETPAIARGRGKGRFRGNEREMMGRSKSSSGKRFSQRRSFFQRPNLPHPLSVERRGPPYIDERMHSHPDFEKTGLSHGAAEERPMQVPLHFDERLHSDNVRLRLPPVPFTERSRMSLVGGRTQLHAVAHFEMTDSTPPEVGKEPGKLPSPPDEEDFDDYRILLQRHRLIQQQLAALENQESSSLVEDDAIIDDSFIDIPVEDTHAQLRVINERHLGTLDDVFEQAHEQLHRFDSHHLITDARNVASGEMGNDICNLLESESSGDGGTPKPFLPFKIKPLHNNVPSIKELSQKDLEQRGVRKYIEHDTGGNNMENVTVKENSLSLTQGKKQGEFTRPRKKNRKKRKRKLSQVGTQVTVNRGPTGNASSLQGAHVDPHNELEARLMSLAGSSVLNHGGPATNREDKDKKRERREKVRQWQEKLKKKDISNEKTLQGNKSRLKKKVTRLSRGDKRRSNSSQWEGDGKVNLSKFESDDYFEIPMDVESDSTDGHPAPPLIEEPVEDFPPPPPPLPNGDFGTPTTSSYVEHGQQSLLMYPPGYFHVDQNYRDWSGASAPVALADLHKKSLHYGELPRHTADVEESHNQRKVHTPDISSQENSDEDDEAALREQLLKSLAVKRKAKLNVGKETKSSTHKSPASGRPHVQSSGASINKEQEKDKQQNSRQVSCLVPPKHDPVVIKLGEDSDSEESGASDSEIGPKTVSSNQKSGGSLFGGLEMMIKEARKSAEASKVKGSGIETEQATPDDTGKPVATSVPKTPDAMDHMPEQMKNEYRRLKEQLANRQKTKQQDKGDSSRSSAPEDQAEKNTSDDSSHLLDLHSYVCGCEENLANHKKLIQQDRTSLTKMMKDIKNKTQSLEVQEANVRKLQQELEAAQKVTLASRMLVRKLRSQAKMARGKITERLSAARNFEEELLRAKSILSAAKRKMLSFTTISDTGSGRNSPQPESLNNAGNENQKFIITPELSQEIKSSIAAKLSELSTLSKQENREKRRLEGTSDSSEEPGAKRPTQRNSSPKVIPASSSSAPDTPSKSTAAQRIAQEKARLKKLEHELSEKLKLFGRKQKDRNENNQVSVLQSEQFKTSTKDTSDVDKLERQHKNELSMSSERTDNSVRPMSERQGLSSREQTSERVERQKENLSSQDSEVLKERLGSISPEQLERIRKLQTEKDKKGPQFSASSFDVPLSAHRRSILCISLPFNNELASIVTDQDCNWLSKEEKVGSTSVVKKDEEDGISCPLKQYGSPLLYFKSYRLSPYFRTEGGFSLSSLTFSNKINPRWPLCNFDLQGKCNDEDCKFQHFIKGKLSEEQTLQDLASYISTLAIDGNKTKEQGDVESFAKAFLKQYGDKMSWEELYILLVNEVKKQRKGSGPFHIYFEPRTWKPNAEVEKEEECAKESDDCGRGIVFNKRENFHSVTVVPQAKEPARSKGMSLNAESQEVRYFVEDYNNMETLEASLDNSPGDVALWIKLARLQLHQNNDDITSDDADSYQDNVSQALSTLSRGLEENTHSEELWLEYLELYSSRCSQSELEEICDQAVEFSPAYSVWWKYIEYSTTYSTKRNVCLRFLSFLVTNPVDPRELHSHRMLEVLLYLVQLELYSGHYKSALAVFKAALGKKAQDQTEMTDLSVHLLPSDFCLAWLAYIHVFEFHRPPAAWFDPRDGKPSRMVTKEDFVFPWIPSQQSRASGEKLLVMFQDALKACRQVAKASSARLSVSLPLYKNLIALEMAYGRVNSARGICRHLLKDNPSVVVLWLCLAALEDATHENGDAREVFEEALVKCKGHAEVAYSAARYYLEKSEVEKALTVLNKCVHYKFALPSKSSQGEMVSLADISSEHEDVDTVALYRKLLSQPLPYDYKCLPLMPDVTPHSLKGEKLYLWLSYCLLLEIAPPSPTAWENLSAESAFETAVHSPLDRQDVHTLWTEYLFYQRSKFLLRKRSLSVHQQPMSELVNRCLMSVSTSSSLPHSSSAVWQDYRFHNQVMNISLSCVPESCWSEEFQKFQRIFPGSVTLALWSCKHEMAKKNYEQAKKICASFLADNPCSISLWKVAIAIELQRKCIKEARKMYQQATEILPFASTLWKDVKSLFGLLVFSFFCFVFFFCFSFYRVNVPLYCPRKLLTSF
ncbi:zinc finger C3H1 domain-containing protein-like isoform X2 [Montipora foliosa]|uniref:zinc finger C3H1 domain-containing protein-like isoform X2 n=1 Tax=Montipora foliosa TaxID=591990 RepID=UPI0035F181CD